MVLDKVFFNNVLLDLLKQKFLLVLRGVKLRQRSCSYYPFYQINAVCLIKCQNKAGGVLEVLKQPNSKC